MLLFVKVNSQKIGQSCNFTYQCETSTICSNGICSCNSTSIYYNIVDNACGNKTNYKFYSCTGSSCKLGHLNKKGFLLSPNQGKS